MSEERGDVAEKTKEDHIQEYAKSLIALDRKIQPYKESKNALKKEYVEEGWLSRDEMSAVLRAYRAVEKSWDLNELDKFSEIVRKVF